MSYQVPQHIDSNKIFIVNRSEIEGRLDPLFYTRQFSIIMNKIKECALYKQLHEIAHFSSESWNQKDYYEDEFPYIEIGAINITDGLVEKVTKIPVDKAPSRAKVLVRTNDIIISTTRPYRGAIVKITGKENLYIASTGFSVIRDVDASVNRDYLYNVLKLNLSLKQMLQRSTGGNYPAITQEELGKILIPLPPIEIQKDFVSQLKVAYLEKHKKDIEALYLLESIDTYLLNELGVSLPEYNTNLKDRVFVINRKSLDNRWDPYYSQKFFRDACVALESCKYPIVILKNIAKLITSGITPKAGGDAYTEDKEIGVPFVRSGNISIEGELNFDDLLYLKPEIHDTLMRSSQLQKNDILIAIVGATIGQVGIYPYDGEANINQAIALVRLKDGYNVQFIKELIKSSIGQLSLNRLKRPVARANINLEEISTIKIVLPPKEKQQVIVDHITSIRLQAKSLQEEGCKILEQAKKEVEEMILTSK